MIIFILSSIPGEEFPKVDFEFSDKIVHVIIYAILFALFFYSLKNQSKYVKLQKHSLNYALLFTSVYGMSDEIHQYFVPNRSCEFADWIADIAGALIVYFIIKQLAKKNKMSIAFLSAILFIGCSGTDNNKTLNDNTKFYFTEHDVWLNQMPVVDVNANNLGFMLSLSAETTAPESEFSVSDLKIYLNNDTISNKKFNLEIFKQSNDILKINITQDNKQMYLDKNKNLPEEAIFEFNVLRNNKKIKNIKTSNLIIIKVY
ncbi:MAG TPA: VanZ family protein [Ignavibacteria bacterium]|nr:VanZ family protein [Ignavibacteria bacterium]